ncbi:HsdM family class I SAM-dependent methyltransferase [Ureaplasma canigenitalium]|uniref:HsdM family class I SAM-dependent methyltransferase n=1 Tax=Ureaplasma canigenitalium TaxID=42092 RepID=UPI0004E124D7|nr:N-6 DNA methylase [Ureaplasma canigenitalium]
MYDLSKIIKQLKNIMRIDEGLNGDAQRIEQLGWIIFLKIFSSREEKKALSDQNYRFILEEKYRYQSLLERPEAGFVEFINHDLFEYLKNINDDSYDGKMLKYIFSHIHNYMKNDRLLKRIFVIIFEIDLYSTTDRHVLGEIYEIILKYLQNAGNAGEFYTPRAVTDFIIKALAPKKSETIADLACGTGGFFASYINYLKEQNPTLEPSTLGNQIFGIEKKSLPNLLCLTNLFLYGINEPQIMHQNTLETTYSQHHSLLKFDLIVMNPPYGAKENVEVQNNFPKEYSSSETIDLFMLVMMARLKDNGRSIIIVPDSFLFNINYNKQAIKEKLIDEYNLNTIIRLPKTVFNPYTVIATNILIFEKKKRDTDYVWYYQMTLPNNIKAFTKTKPVYPMYFNDVLLWLKQKKEIEGVAFKVKINDLKTRKYNLDISPENNITASSIQNFDDIVKNFNEGIKKDVDELTNIFNAIKKILGD